MHYVMAEAEKVYTCIAVPFLVHLSRGCGGGRDTRAPVPLLMRNDTTYQSVPFLMHNITTCQTVPF